MALRTKIQLYLHIQLKKACENPIRVKKPISVKRLQTIKNSGQVSSSQVVSNRVTSSQSINISPPLLAKRYRQTPVRFDPAPQIQLQPESQDEFTAVRRQFAQNVMELNNQETARDMLENADNAQHRDFHLDTDNNETISISHMQRDDIQTRSFLLIKGKWKNF
jgi:hypothetical protein